MAKNLHGHPLPRFDALCEALKRNDPSHTTVKVVWEGTPESEYGFASFPDQYGRQLGEALHGNTIVESIELQLGYLRERADTDDTSAVKLLHFLRHSQSLRMIKLRTSGTIDGDREIPDDETELVELAVMAVAENRHRPIALHLDDVDYVEEGSYPVDVPPDTLIQMLNVSKSIVELKVWLGDGGTPGHEFDEFNYDGEPDEEPDEGKEAAKAAARAGVAEALANNCTVQRLIIYQGCDARAIQAVQQVLHRNGCLLSVVGMYEESSDEFARFQPLIDRCCARNKGILDFLTKLIVIAKHDSQKALLFGLVVPLVFDVLQETPRVACSRILQCLLTMMESVGPQLDTKRQRQLENLLPRTTYGRIINTPVVLPIHTN